MSAYAPKIKTPVTELLGIKHPIVLAGMNGTSSPRLAAAVTNAGGLGVIGGGTYTPEQLSDAIDELKSYLHDKNAPFGVDLMIPKVGGSARKTNYDYLHGNLDKCVDIMIEKKTTLFVCAIGVPPIEVVKKLHAAGVLYMNMCGAPKHATAAAKLGADLVCATGGEAGGHTGDIPTSVLIPAVKEAIRDCVSPHTNQPVMLLAGGGIYNGRSLAAALALGADAVWVGTRFILCDESGSTEWHQEQVRGAQHGQVVRSTIFTGRPLHSLATPYLLQWEDERKAEMKQLEAKGIIAAQHDRELRPDDDSIQEMPILMGKVAAVVDTRLPAKQIVEDMVEEAAKVMAENSRLLVASSKL
ncbi:hypothetical protein E8E14_013763 [Neopestalotiopsis sp. 37M]|nr:hypothetical protein E8E14_013763 [Neopestalotiopsis sp. 37M]